MQAATNLLLANVKQEDLQSALDFLPSSPFLLPKQEPSDQLPPLSSYEESQGLGMGMGGMNSMDTQFLMSVANQADRSLADAEAGMLPGIDDDGSLTDEESCMLDPSLLPQGQLDSDDYGQLLLSVHQSRGRQSRGRQSRGRQSRGRQSRGRRPGLVPNSHNKDNGARATRRKIVSASQITPREDGGRDYCCDVYGCSKTFRDRSGLRKHCDAKHSFICPHSDCTFVLNAMDSFLKHMHEHNYEQDQQENKHRSKSRRTRRKRSDSGGGDGNGGSGGGCAKKQRKAVSPDEKANTDAEYLQCDFGLQGNPADHINSDSSPTSVAQSVYEDFPIMNLA
jgi:hypothetical protein